MSDNESEQKDIKNQATVLSENELDDVVGGQRVDFSGSSQEGRVLKNGTRLRDTHTHTVNPPPGPNSRG
ncbi:hypothetical protein RP726_06475 [Candidatus Methylospira mobilis]|uniref:hypothetical protein n=1 Tax=Candidatus Methylospira mobilis TaxID=1808979 RepID=UPI0028E806D5|nr:hypothetical protein [Candidatus Methylospira mobilis]WNV06058.1 hypothetical protein RP726_06475 [Candidatus Methylospira mobilis]